MTKRSPAEVGQLIRQRREELGLSQEAIEGVSSSSVRKIENATAEDFRRSTIVAYMRALGWAPDAYERMRAGENPASLYIHFEDPPPRLQSDVKVGGLTGIDRLDDDDLAELQALIDTKLRRRGQRP